MDLSPNFFMPISSIIIDYNLFNGFFPEINHETCNFLHSFLISCLKQLLRITCHKTFFFPNKNCIFFVCTFSIHLSLHSPLLHHHPFTLPSLLYSSLRLAPQLPASLPAYHKRHSPPPPPLLGGGGFGYW